MKSFFVCFCLFFCSSINEQHPHLEARTFFFACQHIGGTKGGGGGGGQKGIYLIICIVSNAFGNGLCPQVNSSPPFCSFHQRGWSCRRTVPLPHNVNVPPPQKKNQQQMLRKKIGSPPPPPAEGHCQDW